MNKSFFLTLYLILTLSVYSQKQQTNTGKDVLYLKNKEIYRGTIIKNELGIISLSVEKDGVTEVLKFQHFDIEKIEQTDNQQNTKEGSNIENIDTGSNKSVYSQNQLSNIKLKATEKNELPNLSPGIDKVNNTVQPMEFAINQTTFGLGKTAGGSFERDPLAPVPDKKATREWTREIRGLRGFWEFSSNFGIDKIRNNNLELSKSIGFQFNPIFYLGVGTSYRLSMNKESSLPVFINPRLNMTDHEDINPFWDVKIGYSPVQAKGTFFSTSLGSSFVFGKKGKLAMNIGLTYSLLNANFKKKSNESPDFFKVKENYHSIGLTLGFEYGFGY